MEKDAKFDQHIHVRLLARDVTAPAELAEAYLVIVTRHLRIKFASVQDDALFNEAAADAILGYCKSPQSYDPTKRGLPGFLRMAAERDLLNLLRRERPHLKSEISTEDVEQAAQTGNITWKEGLQYDLEDSLVAQIDHERAAQDLWNRFRDPRDRKMLELMQKGERRTSKYAEILKITVLSSAEQRKMVKQHKDRINKEIERMGARRHGH